MPTFGRHKGSGTLLSVLRKTPAPLTTNVQKSLHQRLRRLLAQTTHLCLLFAVTLACSSPPVVVRQLPSPVRERQVDALDPALLDAALGGKANDPYRVGPGDKLFVAVYGHPELSIGQYAGPAPTTGQGLVIDNDGTIQFPLVGSVPVAGKSADELRTFLERELAVYVKDPRVTVQVSFNGSLRFYLLGQFESPGLKYSDRPVRLLEALALGGSIQLQSASLRSAYISRDNKRLPVNFFRLIREGDLTQNIKLKTGDVILVPDSQNEKAFVFGGATGSNPQGGAVPFNNGKLSLLQALVQAGFGIRERTQSKLSEVRIIRSEGDRGELFIVDATQILDGKAASFELVPGDIVYVPITAITSWNEALVQLLPTLQLVSGILSPFVQIKYLSRP
jgi:polysaccharide biosynthesis/export protein